MFETLFGSEMPLAARFFIAFLIVLALIGLTAWLVRRFGANRLGTAARGRQPRLAVIDAATVDGRRRLVLIRRDNIEHLLMIGGPTDLVVEPNIVRAVAAREVAREPARATPAEPAVAARPSATMDNGWPLQPATEQASAPAPRPYRSTATEEPWLPPEPGARPRPTDNFTGLAAELSSRLGTADHAPPPIPRSEPAARIPTPVEPPSPTQADHNLAEMAQQLEAALRRAPAPAPAPEVRPPVVEPLAGHINGPTVNATARAQVREFKARVEPKFETRPESKFEPKAEPKFDMKAEPREPAATPGKQLYENLEEEMASLLGRPASKS
ncbi:MAG TPA: flagellar biosynthesis protein FliO [Pseudolabrys sp.]|nr:flagellar biosynthesis protein FliO [Pseudolabrys sp.]